MILTFVKHFLLIFFCSLTSIWAQRPLPSKEDCIALWNVVGGVGGDLRNVAAKNSAAMGGVLKLYEDCLRSEEGIRYRRNGWSKGFGYKINDLLQLLKKLDDS